MRGLIGAFLLLLFLVWAARGSADHYPAEVEYLNGTALIHEMSCRALDPSLEDAVCRVLTDTRAEVSYFVLLYGGKVLRVWKYGRRFEQATVIFRAPQER